MLRRAENVRISHQPGMLTGKGWVTVLIGRQLYRISKMHKSEFARAVTQQWQYPMSVVKVGERNYWQFRDRFYWENEDLTADEVYALLVTRQQRQAQRIERAQQIVATGSRPRSAQPRGAIPDDVKQLVWTRDGGRCRHCGSQSELQFDHIIPVSLGGGSTPENLQVLCGPCNRRKSGGLTVR